MDLTPLESQNSPEIRPRSESWIVSLLEATAAYLRGRPALFLLPARDSEPEREKLRWLIGLRYSAIWGMFFVAVFASWTNAIDLDTAVFVASVAIVFLFFNLTTHRTWAKASGRPVSPLLTLLQLLIDLFVLTTLIASTGGASNPFVAIFYVHAALGGMLLVGVHSVIFIALVHTCLTLTQYLAFKHSGDIALSLAPFAVQHIVALTGWAITTSLGRHLGFTQERLLQLRLVNERLDRLRSLGALAAGLAHEFASPLTTARIRLDRLHRKQVGDREDLTEARLAIEKCESVLRTMTGSIADSRDMDFEAIDLARHVERVVEGWRAQTPERHVSVEVATQPLLRLPPLNLAQTLLNLLDNAHEASPPGEPIRVSLLKSGWDTVVSVEDRGEGFAADVLLRMGEPFNTGKSYGTGLGLYSAQLFLQSVGGELKISNRRNERGAEVQMRFPSSLEGAMT